MASDVLGWRLEVTDLGADEAGARRARAARAVLGEAAGGVEQIRDVAVYVVDRDLDAAERDALLHAVVDPGTQRGEWVRSTARPLGPGELEVALRPGVTDPVGEALVHTAELLGLAPLRGRAAVRYAITPPTAPLERIADALLHNPVVDELSTTTTAVPAFDVDDRSTPPEIVAVTILDAEGLASLSKERGLALDPAELLAVQAFFRDEDREPTDAELETIAQTWSEHCAHKTFRAELTWEDGEPIEPLLQQLRRSTERIAAPFVVSAFVDNAGIVAFDERHDLAVKVETHNHPSAIEPFGGANTGVGGVIRDVLGVAADPIAVTDVLCFGPADVAASELPAGVLHPRRIADGVVAGIADYGNKLGLPTVAGAIVHQAGFTANPLVFCGCIGLRPRGLVLPGASAGDRIVVLGGSTGRDGIRGATFSSATMDATTGDVAGASVQIGDPIVEKLVADALRDARDAGLFTAITDCGAGGFSSAIGELAAELGADVDLDPAPRKYPGLAPWEVWLSEAQERMVIAVRPGDLPALRALCHAYGVQLADLGSFRDDGRLVVRCAGHVIVDLPGSFLHDGRPRRRLVAQRPTPPPSEGVRRVEDPAALLLAVLAHPDVRSNEDVVRGYDHEILGATVGRPYQGAADDGPADAAVVAPRSSPSGAGLAIGIGLSCRTGRIDARRMAEAAVDEAIRNVVAVGADPDRVAILDNFSWGDPRRPETMGRLVDAVAGCVAAAERHGAPFVSGKDSLNNEYLADDGERHAIPPTLVITAVGVLPSAEQLVTSDAKRADDLLVLVGSDPAGDEGLRGSVLDAVLGVDGEGDVPGGDGDAPARYRAVHAVIRDGLVAAAHDVADGGLLVTLAEMAMGGRLGIDVTLDGAPATWFSEATGRIVVEVSPDDAAEVCRVTGGRVIGRVTSDARLAVRDGSGRAAVDLGLDALLDAWKGHATDVHAGGAA